MPGHPGDCLIGQADDKAPGLLFPRTVMEDDR